MLPFCKDGDLDLVVGENYKKLTGRANYRYTGTLKYYRNTGSSGNPLYSELTGLNDPFNGVLCPACLHIGRVCA